MNAWLVVRHERHVDDKYWVCLSRDDALRIAQDVDAYWSDEYGDDPNGDDYRELLGDQIFNHTSGEAFSVVVEPIVVRQPGETDKVSA